MHRGSAAGSAPVLDVLDADGRPVRSCRVRAWRPDVAGVSEVFHARIADYSYPAHAHDTWTVLIIDAGAIRYDLDTRQCGVSGDDHVAVLPPGVVHDGRPAAGTVGFRKRNLYLDPSFLPTDLIGAAVDRTALRDGELRTALSLLHDSLAAGEEALDAEARLALIADRLARHLVPARHRTRRSEPAAARRLRDLLDEHPARPVTLAEAARLLDRSVPHLVRSFARTYGVSPHAYLVGRRVELARKLLLAGTSPADAAVRAGFYDQAHLTRHFRRHTSVTPAAYARSGR